MTNLTTFGTISTCARALGGAADEPVSVTVQIEMTAGSLKVLAPMGVELVPSDALRRKIELLSLGALGDNAAAVIAALKAARWTVV